ncbi:MAG: phosphotransferase enzyme family protein [Acidimicrobiia bacterium]
MDASRIAKEASHLLPLAHRVLTRYPFLTREVEHLATHSNVMYRVITESGQQLVLRVGNPHANTRSNIGFEVAWLDALNRETSLDVVTPIRTAGGGLIVDEFDSDLGKERPCVLFTWIPGAPLGDGAGTFGYRLLGQMSASLSKHGKTWVPPLVGQMRTWDRIFYYGAEMDPVIIDDPLFGHIFEAPRRALLKKAATIAARVIKESWADGGVQVVHGDLHEWNVHVVGSRLHAFDFEDMMIALPAQDVAISLYHSRDSDQRDDIRKAFRRGYEAVGEWPIVDESQLDGFHAGRQVMLMNYAARTLPIGEAFEYLDHVTPWLQTFVGRYG